MRLLVCTQALDRTDPILGFFHRWVEEFATHCEQVTVICLFEGEHALPANVKVYSLGKEKWAQNARGAPPAGIAHAILRLRYAARTVVLAWRLRKSYSAVFVHMNPEYLISAGWLWQLLGKRVGLWYAHKSVPLRLRMGAAFANKIFTASIESFRLASSKLRIMGHGIDTARHVPNRVPAPGVVRLITTGRISQSKGLSVLIDAYLKLKAGGRAISFKVFGAPITQADTIYKSGLVKRLQAAGEQESGVFVGAVPHDDLPGYRAHADYLVHASETGSLDKNVLDAAMSGTIPVSSSEAYSEFFKGYEDLLQFKKGDGSALAERIVALEALPEVQRQEIRKDLRERVESQHSLASLIVRLIKELHE